MKAAVSSVTIKLPNKGNFAQLPLTWRYNFHTENERNNSGGRKQIVLNIARSDCQTKIKTF